jgi:hypothetical protein
MKKALFIGILLTVLGFSTLGNGALIDNGNGLIYDTDLNITWYDYMNFSRGSWYSQRDWAANLSITDIYGQSHTGWRLPATIDGPYVFGYNGTTTAGYNIITSEMGHLYYTELGNKGYFAPDGTGPQPGWQTVNTGPFTGLIAGTYWSATEYSGDDTLAWVFSYYDGGVQWTGLKDFDQDGYLAMAVHDGNVGGAPVPIPGAIMLFAPGLAGLAVLRRGFKK